jgi:hypothetical protein
LVVFAPIGRDGCVALHSASACLDAVLGSDHADSRLTDGADHAPEIADIRICSKECARVNARGAFFKRFCPAVQF